MSSFEKEILNPLELMARWYPGRVDHIKFDSKLQKGDYFMRRQSSHDGTASFTFQMFESAFLPLVNMSSVSKSTCPKNWEEVIAIRYTVGPMRHAKVFGKILLACSNTHKYPGMRERISFPVVCEYLFKGK